jgi:hypothetical protein
LRLTFEPVAALGFLLAPGLLPLDAGDFLSLVFSPASISRRMASAREGRSARRLHQSSMLRRNSSEARI